MTSFLDLLREDKKITFLLGAGSSVSAGFPTDTQLRDNVADYMLNENIIKNFEAVGFTKEDCLEFRTRLIRGGYSTIDELINSFTKYAVLGKMAILRCILAHEDLSNNDTFFSNKHWYMPFFLTIQKEGLIHKLSNVTFITLNYDRSLQHFIHEFSLNRGISHKPKILHLHGRLPPLQFEIQESHSLPYGDYNLDGHALHKHATGINSLADIHDDNEHYEQARNIIRRSNYLFIMGFGFHEPIVERLNLKEMNLRNLQVYSLSIGLKATLFDAYPEFNFYDSSIFCTDFAKNLNEDIDANLEQSANGQRNSRTGVFYSNQDDYDSNDYDFYES
ncbi:hypothetical protein SHI21_13350 [Bacteriovorax sp. PP10]|uniref:SIR2-like domain-containing protein n=1 Tax=Bacteriovorax antarcticus TaxID=3088717 RepID=A0ABU5VVW6_9BACT|nr:hypothetical protein [Bacteriovorax sp. PP10]MEA9357204.1 hypothetical protein [Bacteriovorax sp. PP10]